MVWHRHRSPPWSAMHPIKAQNDGEVSGGDGGMLMTVLLLVSMGHDRDGAVGGGGGEGEVGGYDGDNGDGRGLLMTVLLLMVVASWKP